MTDPRLLRIDDFTYELPDERIAKHPLPQRDESKLLIYRKGNIDSDVYRNIHQHLPAGSLLVFNNTRVVEARLVFKKPTGGEIEVFCLEPDNRYPDITTAMAQQHGVFWKCLVGGASKWKHGMVLEKKMWNDEQEVTLTAAIASRESDSFIIHLQWTPGHYSFAEMLHLAGQIPLPPYLHRPAEEADKERYQTIYARQEGSVAAPTAGLHFTDTIFEHLHSKNIETGFVTLHVGAGTFKPVKSDTVAGHEMHAEFLDVEKHFISRLKEHVPLPVIAVGTTSVRTLETLYWLGVKIALEPGILPEALTVYQWDPYDIGATSMEAAEALGHLLHWMDTHQMDRIITKTQILIAPGYQCRIIDGLVTNFHQPQSTLLLLIAALMGDDWKKAYAYALENDFRFLSYGDGCLIWNNN